MPTSTTFTSEESGRLPGPAWLQAERRAAYDRFVELDALPTEAEEIWRYSRISDLELDAFRPSGPAPEAAARPDRLATVLDAIGERAGLAVTWNGVITSVDQAGGRATIASLAEDADGAGLIGSVAGERDAFSILNAAFSAEPVVIRVANGVAESRPFVVVHWIDGDGVGVF